MRIMSPALRASAATRMAVALPTPPKIEIARVFANGAENTDDGSAMIAPAEIRILRAADDTALVLQKVFVSKSPRAFDIDDAHPFAPAARAGPGIARVNSSGSDFEVKLARDETRG